MEEKDALNESAVRGAGVGAGVGWALMEAEAVVDGVAEGLAVAGEQPVTIAATAIIDAASFFVFNKAVLLLRRPSRRSVSPGSRARATP
jgi:hypothetical protein